MRHVIGGCMSNYYLCDVCANNTANFLASCVCEAKDRTVRKIVTSDGDIKKCIDYKITKEANQS